MNVYLDNNILIEHLDMLAGMGIMRGKMKNRQTYQELPILLSSGKENVLFNVNLPSYNTSGF